MKTVIFLSAAATLTLLLFFKSSPAVDASHLTHKVPMPPNVTAWDICFQRPEEILEDAQACIDMGTRMVQGMVPDMNTQCIFMKIINDCLVHNITLYCPAAWLDYYIDMTPYLPTIILFCGDVRGIITPEEMEHKFWIWYEMEYWIWANATHHTTVEPEMESAANSSQQDMSIDSAEPVDANEDKEESTEGDLDGNNNGTRDNGNDKDESASAEMNEETDSEEEDGGKDEGTTMDDSNEGSGDDDDHIIMNNGTAMESQETPEKESKETSKLMKILTTAAAPLSSGGDA